MVYAHFSATPTFASSARRRTIASSSGASSSSRRNVSPPGVAQPMRIVEVHFPPRARVLRAKGASMFGSDQDDTIVVPYTTGMKRFAGVTMLRMINVQASSPEQMTEVQNGIAEHRNDDFAGDLPTLGARSESAIKIRSRP